ncbi:hypothetical protein MKW94_002789 [Papaver nudicaule]|uniref:Uncharacterized protein n=1 Tax=Papaver nudicaule TaxID=74823 RepID=A0AA41VDA0_PAPNU|nr:hypothetical protein [Papaver nudicaule]
MKKKKRVELGFGKEMEGIIRHNKRDREDGAVMRKGPWMAEEDEILMAYVDKYGPRDWSSIRSKGLLPRTGKSCRLRWVNKLKPDLKTGCKFSAEEERIVIDLQARFGNKWARIATYLQGRTDNDVKNFWSTRQKRLARILQTPTVSKSQKNNGKSPVFHELPSLEHPSLCPITMQEDPASMSNSCQPSSYMGNNVPIKMVALPDLVKPNNLNNMDILSEMELPPTIERKPFNDQPQPLPFAFPQLPVPELDIPLLSETQDLDLDVFGRGEICEPENGSQFPLDLPFFGLGNADRDLVKGGSLNTETPDSFFDDFPPDMFDYMEPPLPNSFQW